MSVSYSGSISSSISMSATCSIRPSSSLSPTNYIIPSNSITPTSSTALVATIFTNQDSNLEEKRKIQTSIITGSTFGALSALGLSGLLIYVGFFRKKNDENNVECRNCQQIFDRNEFENHQQNCLYSDPIENQPTEISIEQIARLIAREFNYEDNLVFDTSYPDGQYKKTADNSKLMKCNPNFQFTNISEGINISVKWFCENYELAKK